MQYCMVSFQRRRWHVGCFDGGSIRGFLATLPVFSSDVADHKVSISGDNFTSEPPQILISLKSIKTTILHSASVYVTALTILSQDNVEKWSREKQMKIGLREANSNCIYHQYIYICWWHYSLSVKSTNKPFSDRN